MEVLAPVTTSYAYARLVTYGHSRRSTRLARLIRYNRFREVHSAPYLETQRYCPCEAYCEPLLFSTEWMTYCKQRNSSLDVNITHTDLCWTAHFTPNIHPSIHRIVHRWFSHYSADAFCTILPLIRHGASQQVVFIQRDVYLLNCVPILALPVCQWKLECESHQVMNSISAETSWTAAKLLQQRCHNGIHACSINCRHDRVCRCVLGLRVVVWYHLSLSLSFSLSLSVSISLSLSLSLSFSLSISLSISPSSLHLSSPLSFSLFISIPLYLYSTAQSCLI